MHRFYLPPDECQATTLYLAGGEAHHARHVLRLRPGDPVIVLDGTGSELACEVRDPERDRVPLRVLQRRSVPPSPCQITLIQALPKGKIFEAIIQKATELGVCRLVPLLSERVSTRLDAAASTQKVQKWRAVAIEAIKQCGSAWLPKIETPANPSQFLARGETFGLSLIASLQPGSRPAQEYFSSYRNEHKGSPRSVCVWVGPEGDFTPDEVKEIQGGGALPITLGPLVLRTETAAVYCLSILNYESQSAP
jgi:16S rRNA (uracil1498-N3)-methyltransferase